MQRHKTFYIDKINEIEYCESKIMYLSGSEFEIPFPVERTETDHTLENCETCADHHQSLISEFQAKLDKFPNCCTDHNNLLQLKEFAVGNFSEVPKWSADKIMFSYHHFLHWIDKDEWYEEITQFFNYCIESYGSFPSKCGEPLEFGNYFACLLHNIKHNRGKLKSDEIDKKIVQERLEKIISYLESFNDIRENIDTDINLLLAKYNEWYKLFPFDLDYFKPLKKQFQITLPIFQGRKKYNKYLGVVSREIHTKESLAEVLIETTKNILSQINGLTLYEEGRLNNAEKIELDLIVEKRRLELKEIMLITNKTSKIYIRTLKAWLRSEKKFIKEIAPLLSNKSSESARPNRTDIAYYCYYMNETNALELGHPFPSVKAWQDIAKDFERHYKNIQLVYNKISKKREERLKPNRAENINFVISSMLGNNSAAIELAKYELKLSLLNS